MGEHIPIFGVMRLFQRIATTCVACCKNLFSRNITARRVQFKIHQFVHVFQNQHVAVQLYDSVIFDERERREFAPTIIESSVVGIVFVHGRKEVLDMLFWNLSNVERAMTLVGEGVGVEGDKRILGSVFLE